CWTKRPTRNMLETALVFPSELESAEKLRVMKTDNAADIRLDAMLENFIFYISRMYEFSHSLGQKRTNHRRPKSTFVRCYSNSGQIVAVPRMSAMCHVWTAPAVQGKNLTFQRSVRVQPCIRPLNAAALAAGPDVIR